MEYIIDGIKYTVTRTYVDDGSKIIDKIIDLLIESEKKEDKGEQLNDANQTV